jgi:hypothetical protein
MEDGRILKIWRYSPEKDDETYGTQRGAGEGRTEQTKHGLVHEDDVHDNKYRRSSPPKKKK